MDDYIIISGALRSGTKELTNRVNEMIRNGYSICDNIIAVGTNYMYIEIHQPMIKTNTYKGHYDIVCGAANSGLVELKKGVNDMLQKGYHICGNLVMIETGILGTVILQPMLKDE